MDTRTISDPLGYDRGWATIVQRVRANGSCFVRDRDTGELFLIRAVDRDDPDESRRLERSLLREEVLANATPA